MNRKSMAILCILFLVSLAASSCSSGTLNIFSPTPTPVPTATPMPTPTPTPAVVLGITEPITIKGVDLLFSEVETRESFFVLMSGIKIEGGISKNVVREYVLTNKTPYDSWIAIKVITKNSDAKSVCNWKGDDEVKLEYVKDGKKVEIVSDMCEASKVDDWVRFFFQTNKEGVMNYEIILPGEIRVPLEGLSDTATEGIIDLTVDPLLLD